MWSERVESLDAAPVQLVVESPTTPMVTTAQIHSSHGTWRLTADAVQGTVQLLSAAR
jgi:hypothetical protein